MKGCLLIIIVNNLLSLINNDFKKYLIKYIDIVCKIFIYSSS